MSEKSGVNLNHNEDIKVNFFDCDPLGIVWHGNYLKYFEIAREAFGAKFGLTYLDVKKHGYAVPIVKTSTKHKLPLKYGESAQAKIELINSESAKLIFRYRLYNNKNQLICEGETVQVFTDIETGELSLVNPPFYSEWKTKHEL